MRLLWRKGDVSEPQAGGKWGLAPLLGFTGTHPYI